METSMLTLTVDTSGNILTWSRDAEALLGYTEAEALGRSIELIIPEHLRGRHHGGFARFVQTGDQHAAGGRDHADGSQKR
jgi:PAS domain S-box-containing protein